MPEPGDLSKELQKLSDELWFFLLSRRPKPTAIRRKEKTPTMRTKLPRIAAAAATTSDPNPFNDIFGFRVLGASADQRTLKKKSRTAPDAAKNNNKTAPAPLLPPPKSSRASHLQPRPSAFGTTCSTLAPTPTTKTACPAKLGPCSPLLRRQETAKDRPRPGQGAAHPTLQGRLHPNPTCDHQLPSVPYEQRDQTIPYASSGDCLQELSRKGQTRRIATIRRYGTSRP